ncbi:glycosyltransferase [Ensifer sp. T173]|uniref:Glycosyltransferase n=1 Tax=Ensifer canadensis TaxID=555315 RepID=A0AAW4FWK7_9HYPH|nr:glycosyltransferase [Ensifer canadensis]MBM3095507.1 glycosyltransferase [Ensifer canadensis]UBI79104.1 glycosyltransferase [Ensifer canadensis]
MEHTEKFVGQYYRYPDLTGFRQAEGGKRLHEPSLRTSSDTPLVTVITVCKNSSKTITQTISSVIDQDYNNIEYIIVDGVSTDGTIEIIKDFEGALDYYISEPDTGIYDAMNKGLRLARGEYIIIVNSDDWYERNAVSSLVSAIRYTDCDFVGALARYFNEDGQSFVLPTMSYNKSTLLRMPVRHESLLIPSRIYDEVGPYCDVYKIIADYEFCVRLYRSGMRYYEVPHPLLNFRTSGVSNTDIKNLHSEHSDLLRRIFPFLAADEASRLSNHVVARPYDFIRVIEKNLDQYDFVLAGRAMLQDYRKVWGGPWSHGPLDHATKYVSYIYPEVSVIIPLKDALSSLEKTIRSLLNQALYDIEVICIDDGVSSDRLAVASDLSQGDRRIRIVKTTTDDVGSGVALNAGIREARGAYIFSFDGRYELADNCLVNFYQAATNNQSDVVFGAFANGDGHKAERAETDDRLLTGAGSVVSNLTVEQFAGSVDSLQLVWGSFCKRDFAEMILYPEKLGAASTSVFLLRAFCTANVVTVVEETGRAGSAQFDEQNARRSLSSCLDELACRHMIWGVLSAAGHLKLANHLLFDDWNPQTFRDVENGFSEDERSQFYRALSDVFQRTGQPEMQSCEKLDLRAMFIRNFEIYGLPLP